MGDLTEEQVTRATESLSYAALYFSDIANQYSNILAPLGVSEDLSASITKIVWFSPFVHVLL